MSRQNQPIITPEARIWLDRFGGHLFRYRILFIILGLTILGAMTKALIQGPPRTSMQQAEQAQLDPAAPTKEPPLSQMSAAAILTVQIVFPSGGAMPPDYFEIEMINDKTAHLHGKNRENATVVKVDDCHFEATRDGNVVFINLGVLSNEHQQVKTKDGLEITIAGTGKEPALCRDFPSPDLCFDDLSLRLLGGESNPSLGESALHTLKAVQFLQKYCPPQRLRF